MNTKPPVPVPDLASTPADSTSDFYNTPWPTGTPVRDEKIENTQPQSENDSIKSPEPAAQIPGLNLVNDKLTVQLPSNDEAIAPSESAGKDNSPDSILGNQEREIHEAVSNAERTMDLEGGATVQQAQGEFSKLDIARHSGDASNVGPTSALEESLETSKTEQGKPQATGLSTVDTMETEPTIVQQIREEANGQQPDGSANNADTKETGETEEGSDHPEWEIDSSPYESSSDDSSTDSSDDRDEDDEDYPILSPEEQARILMQAELGSDDEGEGKGKTGGHVKTTNELPEEVLPIPDITITPDKNITLLGTVSTVVENAVLIEANVSGEYQVLESGSLLCFEDRSIAGVVSETLGRVEQPLYTVLYSTPAEIEKRGVSKGKVIYYVDCHSTFVFTQPLKGIKGSDASNLHDEEIGEDEVEFSDDEAEAEYKRKMKQKRQEKKEAKYGRGGAQKTRRGAPGPSKLSQTELNYDDGAANEDGYTPLARPKNLHELMGHQEAPVESSQYSGRGNFRGDRGGRGRGSDRSRGNRGWGARGELWQSREDSHSRQQNQQPPVDSLPRRPTYGQPAYPPNVQPAYSAPQQPPSYQPQPYMLGSVPAQFPFQFPYPQAYQQPNLYQQFAAGAHVNPAFLAALQQQQQLQQQQLQCQQAQQTQNSASGFDQVRAQLDLLRQLSGGGNQGPRPT